MQFPDRVPGSVQHQRQDGTTTLYKIQLMTHRDPHHHATQALLVDCFRPERFLLPLAAYAKSTVSAAQDAACCEASALHNPAFLAILKTA